MNITLRLNPRPRKDGRTVIYYDVTHTKENKQPYRNSIFTSVKVKKTDLNKTSLRVRANHRDSETINKSIEELEQRRDTAINKFQAKEFTLSQLVSYLKGESNFNTVDDYVNTIIKKSRTGQTYLDYKNTLQAFKRHTNKNADELVTWSEFMSFEMLDTFKRNALAKGVKPTSINSYFNKIRAIINDAYDKQYIYQKFTLNKKLRCKNARRKQITTTTPEEFKKSINKIKSIYDAQALALYLLMFMLRGMYPADIVSLKKAKFNNGDSDPILKLCEKGYDYITHRRSKTKNTANDDLIIRIDLELLNFISWIKYSFYYTHYYTPKKDLLADFDDEIAIFNYGLDENSTHAYLWDIYQKKIKKLLGVSFNTARKTYNTFALELDMSHDTRTILLGHADTSMLKHYDNKKTKKMRDKIQLAHMQVLNEFKAFELIEDLLIKIKTLDLPNTIKDLYNHVPRDKAGLLDSFKEFKTSQNL